MAGAMRIDLADYREALTGIGRRAPRAIARAINRSIKSGQTVMVRNVAKDMGIKQALVRERIRLDQATVSKFAARLVSSPKRLPLIAFNAKGPEPSRGAGRGVTYRGLGGRRRLPNAFIATMRSGHRGVFKRSRRSRLPIRELQGPSVAQVFDRHLPAGMARSREQLIKNLGHELTFAVRDSRV